MPLNKAMHTNIKLVYGGSVSIKACDILNAKCHHQLHDNTHSKCASWSIALAVQQLGCCLQLDRVM